jgi:2-amino-4-hydroxy-6-hydroxymethyldihydropteridine diphosphokinase
MVRRTGARRVVFALGSNLGDRLANLQAGIDHLAAVPGVRAAAVSGVYETAPVGGPRQPDYLNAVMVAESALSARELLGHCQAAERELGRVRTVVWGPRTLDVDLISCDDEVSSDPELTLPHPRAHLRAFVLAPWHDADPGACLVGHGPVAGLLDHADRTGVSRIDGLTLVLT